MGRKDWRNQRAWLKAGPPDNSRNVFFPGGATPEPSIERSTNPLGMTRYQRFSGPQSEARCFPWPGPQLWRFLSERRPRPGAVSTAQPHPGFRRIDGSGALRKRCEFCGSSCGIPPQGVVFAGHSGNKLRHGRRRDRERRPRQEPSLCGNRWRSRSPDCSVSLR